MANNLYNTMYNPDVLSCIANLSNDEVFTPPEVANAMLDLLPQELFNDPNTTFLDPACKSGVFLREIAKRLLKGLEPFFPDLQERTDHIFKKQLFGIAITELTSHLSRRSLYCSKFANGKYSVTKFDNIDGNVRFKNVQHVWKDGKCAFCGTSQTSDLGNDERGLSLEAHAYEMIHTIKPMEIFNMKFDVIIGNPPYQLSTGGGQMQARPIYHLFIQQAIKMNPRFLVMITPSRWFAGGMGLEEFRSQMLHSKHLKEIVDYSLSTICFPGVDIAGGVNYFLYDANYSGTCRYTYIDKENVSTKERDLDQYEVFVRNNHAITIVEKVLSSMKSSMVEHMSALSPFGLPSSERGQSMRESDTYELLSSGGRAFISKKNVKSGFEYIDKYKVVIGKATSAGAATAGSDGLRKVIATLDVLPPQSVCTFSYFIAGLFDTFESANNCKKYLQTKFARFLLLQSLSSINISREKFRFVPAEDFSKEWTDRELYLKYGLNDDEQLLIENTIKPMNGGDE